MSQTELIPTPTPPFQLYFNGNNVKINIESDKEFFQIIRFCTTEKYIFLLSKNYNLYYCEWSTCELIEINLILLKMNIIDIEIYLDEIYLVNFDGTVIKNDLQIFNDQWTEINFNVCENNKQNIQISRVKCNSIGIIYLTNDHQIYGNGKCGNIFPNIDKPTKLALKLSSNQQRIIDISCGDDFFVILSQFEIYDSDEIEEEINLHDKKLKNPIKTMQIKKTNLIETNLKCDSKDSLVSGSSSGHSSINELDIKIQEILKQGYYLINTNVYSFGISNNGVLGTGDHIKRTDLNEVLNLDRIGCHSVSCGREHSLARTIDGRIYHWGLNSQKQIDSSTNIKDLTSPKELNHENYDEKILDGICSDYKTILCNNKLEIFENSSKKRIPIKNDIKKMTNSLEDKICKLYSISERNSPIILSSNKFTLINNFTLQSKYLDYFKSIQSTVQQLIKNSYLIKNLKLQIHENIKIMLTQKKLKSKELQNTRENYKFALPICYGYFRILYALTTCLKSIELFYRNDINFMDLLFIKNSKELIEIFQEYTRIYCDLKSIGGLEHITKIFELNSLPNDINNKLQNTEQIFILPFMQITNILQFLEDICKNNLQSLNLLNDKYLEWQELMRTNRIAIELSEHTEDFWLKNSRNQQIRPFKKRSRRVILDSTNIPLKLSNGSAFTTHSFILFSDCLLQYGSQLQTYPLMAMWIKVEGEFSIRIFTPEKSFLVVTKSHEHKMLWFDQLESSILTVLNKQIGSKLTNIRTTAYTFGNKHQFYPNVRAYGRWRLGIMHGTCYLEYPDGKIYFGNIKNNQIDGYGKMIIPTVGIYEGQFKDGKFSGYGFYEMKDNTIYDGHFRDGMFHGHGILRTNFSTYVGEFAADVKNGYGILDDMQNGDKYMGMFADNKRIGSGICISMSGDYFEGFFVNNEISGDGLAIFENGYYYLGEMTMKGPNGKGTYYMAMTKVCSEVDDNEEESKNQMLGNIISGNLNGTWEEVRVITGTVALNKTFLKFPKEIGDLVVDNNRKWRSLFDNWEEEIFGENYNTIKNTKELWNKIAIYMTAQKEKDKNKTENINSINKINTNNTNSSYFAKNIMLQTNYYDNLDILKLSNSLDTISLKSTTSLYTKKCTLDIQNYDNFDQRKKSYSNEELFDKDIDKYCDDNIALTQLNSFINFQQFNCNNLIENIRTSNESTTSCNGNINIIQLDYVPNFGIESLTGEDFEQIKEYLGQAFKDPYHPLSLLNQRISNCFYTSYGCWKVKPTQILAYQAIQEWESISERVYNLVRKLFPALPEDYCEIEGYREIISHISLLYPIVLSEGVYSTLFVLYANKFSQKDELYRQRILLIESKTDEELIKFLSLDNLFTHIINNEQFQLAIQTLKQITEEYSPKGMLDVIEKSMQLISEAHKIVSENTVILAADNMIPLAIFLIMRANVPHLGAELALLDDLTGKENFELNMSGSAGYCYTTIKAAYEHIINGNLFQN